MMRRRFLHAVVAALAVGIQQAHGQPLTFVQSIPLEAVAGRIDHFALDAASKLLYVAALGNDSVERIDLAAGKHDGTIHGMKEPQGLAVLPESRCVAVASGGDGTFQLFNPDLSVLRSIPDLEDADNVRADVTTGHMWVGYGGGALAEIDPATGRIISNIALDGHPESFQLASQGPRIYANVPSAGHVAVVDRSAGNVLATWPLGAWHANYPMALDETCARLFVVCRQPARILALDTNSGQVMASLECCGDADDIWLDAAAKRLYVTGGEGCVTVVQIGEADHYEPLESLQTAAGARTSFFDVAARRLYVAVPRRGSQGAEIRVYQAN